MISSALGLLVAGPAGAALGGASAFALSKGLAWLGDDLTRRLLSPREQQRVGLVFGQGCALIAERLEGGDRLRSDDFFEPERNGRSDAQEVMESVLLRSQREPEERKLPYLARLFANIPFAPEVGAEMAHQITKTAEQLTYRQYCVLKLAATKGRWTLRNGDYRGQKRFASELYQVLYEVMGLYQASYINFGGGVAFGPTDVKPGAMVVQGLGADTCRLMELHLIEDEDVAPIARLLAD